MNLHHLDEWERNATRFALRILAPTFVIKDLVRKGITDVEKMSTILGVEKELLKNYILPF